MEVKPLKKMVLIAEQKRETTTESGIIIEGRGTGDMAKATVLAVGPEVTEVKVGDVVLPEWGKASIVKVDGSQRAMIKEEFIIAVFE
jgi:co-chaperonin GroES (HSP10)